MYIYIGLPWITRDTEGYIQCSNGDRWLVGQVRTTANEKIKKEYKTCSLILFSFVASLSDISQCGGMLEADGDRAGCGCLIFSTQPQTLTVFYFATWLGVLKLVHNLSDWF